MSKEFDNPTVDNMITQTEDSSEAYFEWSEVKLVNKALKTTRLLEAIYFRKVERLALLEQDRLRYVAEDKGFMEMQMAEAIRALVPEINLLEEILHGV